MVVAAGLAKLTTGDAHEDAKLNRRMDKK